MASQAAADRQVQAAQQLEAAANSLYQSTTNVFNFARECAGPHNTWRDCAAQAMQVYPNSQSVLTTFNASGSNIADRTAIQLANQLSGEAGGIINAQSAGDANRTWNDMVTTYVELIGRCGQLVQTK